MPKDPTHTLRELERHRLRERERQDLEVEARHGPRPLEGYSHAPTSWTQDQNDLAAIEVHADDAAASRRESEAQVARLEVFDPDRGWTRS